VFILCPFQIGCGDKCIPDDDNNGVAPVVVALVLVSPSVVAVVASVVALLLLFSSSWASAAIVVVIIIGGGLRSTKLMLASRDNATIGEYTIFRLLVHEKKGLLLSRLLLSLLCIVTLLLCFVTIYEI
jgi:hypothetical protein